MCPAGGRDCHRGHRPADFRFIGRRHNEDARIGGLYFYDAIAPIVNADSLDMSKLFRASRYGDGEGDYLNAAMDEAAYRNFVSRDPGSGKG